MTGTFIFYDAFLAASVREGWIFAFAIPMCGRSLTLDRLAYNAGVISKNRTLQRVIGRLSSQLMLQKVKLTINLRDMQRICVQKPMVAPSAS